MVDAVPNAPDDNAPPVLPRAPSPRRGGRVGAVVTALLAVAVVALWGATWAGREVRAPPFALTAVVTFLPYLYAGLAALAFAAWSAMPDRRDLPFVLAAPVLSGLLLWGPAWTGRGETAEGTALTVMTWNVQRLWGDTATGDPRTCVAGGIRAAEPDVIALLEVTADDVAALSAGLGLSCVHTPYEGGADPRIGGLATCVRGDRWRLVGGEPQQFVDDEAWFYTFAEVAPADAPERRVNVLAVHLHPYAFSTAGFRRLTELARGEDEALRRVVRVQGAQSVALLEHVDRFRDPTVVAGDFNSTPDNALHAALRDSLVDAWERGGRGFGGTVRFLGVLPLRIDYVYVTPSLAVEQSRVPPLDCGDHRPIVSRLVLKRGE